MSKTHVFDQYLRTEKLPIFAVGLRKRNVVSSIIRAIERTGIDQTQVVLVAGSDALPVHRAIWIFAEFKHTMDAHWPMRRH